MSLHLFARVRLRKERPLTTTPPRHLGGAMLRESVELTSPEVAMVHRGERVLLLHQVGWMGLWAPGCRRSLPGSLTYIAPEKNRRAPSSNHPFFQVQNLLFVSGRVIEICWVDPPPPCFTMDKQAIHFYGLGPVLTFTESTVTGWGVYPRNLKKKNCFLGRGEK